MDLLQTHLCRISLILRENPPLTTETTDGWIQQQDVNLTRFAKENTIESQWELLQPPLFNEW